MNMIKVHSIVWPNAIFSFITLPSAFAEITVVEIYLYETLVFFTVVKQLGDMNVNCQRMQSCLQPSKIHLYFLPLHDLDT